MSFMFLPLDYDDWSAINKPILSKEDHASIIVKNSEVMKNIANSDSKVIHIDGYVGANFDSFVQELLLYTSKKYKLINMMDFTLEQQIIDNMTQENLPDASEEDPVKLFGKLYEGNLIDLFDSIKLQSIIKDTSVNEFTIIYGHGAALKQLLTKESLVLFLDITPKNAAVRARENKFKNIGDYNQREFSELMRRNYYVDFEVVIKHRTNLLSEDLVDYYVDANFDDNYKMLPMSTLKNVFNATARQPFRCKPVYLEGIWGGEYIRKIRNIPKEISKNIAWIFEFIPMEVSIVFEIGNERFETPFSTFLKHSGKEIMGVEAHKAYGGYFPIRFNYDDTWHSNGNMSIQVHPGANVTKPKYGELGGQDEAYYIIATGHDAKTYIGFKDEINGKEFMDLAQKSHEEGTSLDYRKYVNAEQSIPGKQFMIPSGTIHSSGRNQFILELGSLTIGSYTYKIYDYNRKDKGGNSRPIHLKMANEVLNFERTGTWIKSNLISKPKLIEDSEDSKEFIIGDSELVYYQTSRVEMKKHGKYVGLNNKQFTTITVVDGESALIYDKNNPQLQYKLNYLEIVTIPSTIEEYVIENTGYQPIVVHKTYLK